MGTTNIAVSETVLVPFLWHRYQRPESRGGDFGRLNKAHDERAISKELAPFHLILNYQQHDPSNLQRVLSLSEARQLNTRVSGAADGS